MKEMTPELRSQLQDVLIEAFDEQGLLRFATERLTFDEVKFADEVDFRQPKSQIVFQIIEVALKYERVDDLIFAVRDARLNRGDAAELIVAFDLEAKETARAERTASSESPDLRESVIRFDERLRERQRQFGFLNAYKELHDLLHDLYDFQVQLRTAIDAIRRAAEDAPDPIGITDPLSVWVVEAQKSAKKTEFPNPPPRWVARFDKAVVDLAGELNKPDPTTMSGSKIERAVEVLTHLPADEQKGLNVELVRCAKRLETDTLIELMDRILAELGKTRIEDAMTSELRARVAGFRILCKGLNDWIADHDCCQNADGAMQEAGGLPEITPTLLSEWSEMKVAFEAVAGRRKGELRAERVLASARDFEAAGQAVDQAGPETRPLAVKKAKRMFERLQERFRDLFFTTDKSLLATTRELLAAAETLNATLRSFK